MDGSMWPPCFEERRGERPVVVDSSTTGEQIAVAISGSALAAVCVLLVVLAICGGNHDVPDAFAMV